MERELGSKQAKASSKGGLNGDAGKKPGVLGRLKKLLPPIFLEAFVLTFLAEWGDRSQVLPTPQFQSKKHWSLLAQLAQCLQHWLHDMQRDDIGKGVLCSFSQCQEVVTSHFELPSGAAQIATIGLAASTDVVGVTLGGILGHAICTGAAVIGGRQLSAHIDERMLSVLGGLLFIAFGMHAVWEVRRVPLIIL